MAKRRYLYTVAVETPCPPVVASAKGEKLDPVAAQVASYVVMSELLRARCAGEDVVARIVFEDRVHPGQAGV